MSVALRFQPRDPVAEARARYRAELSSIVDELSEELGYDAAALARASLADGDGSAEVAHLLVAARVLRRPSA